MIISEQRIQSKVILLASPAIRADRRKEFEAKKAELIEAQRKEKEERQARVNLFVERWNHAIALFNLCKRLADVYNVPCSVNNATLFKLLNAYNWQCPFSRVSHSCDTPISLAFAKPLHQGGAISINNIVPKHFPHLLVGEYEIKRDNLLQFPPKTAPLLDETQEMAAIA